ncbi:ABC transporter permease [Paenibacillus albiflavus]|uniref:ABC transporter permease n=1 Tax=Paenibacillus albiflavus TaxID=2545760 RepID=A0A4R4E7A3_9BACL|nr:ABC transporter permease subunit [Paenibacillus albiflavus]TCZ73595.1 ABC transporter permease [Paenibacillus albiflavus]
MNLRQILTNPMLDKEFRLRMRTPRYTFSLLFYILALSLVAMGYIYMSNGLFQSGQNRFNPESSRIMFYILSIGQLILVAFMTPGLTAGVISGEREKQTLNILLTTQQSSASIILSKLVSSLSFMTLIVIATLPIYSIVFLYGGISPKQLLLVFLFYLFIMLLLGSLGVLFSTVFKRTVVAIIVTYGVGGFIFLGTGLLYIFLMAVSDRGYSSIITNSTYSWVGYILGLNPAGALMSIFEEGFSKQVFLMRGANVGTASAPIELWLEFVLFYSIIIIGALWLSIRKIRPVARKSKEFQVEQV